MLDKFVSGQQDFRARLSQALADADWAGAVRIAHTLKGVAAQIGATELPVLAAQLESNHLQKISGTYVAYPDFSGTLQSH